MSTTTSNLGLFKYDTTNPTDLASAFNINTALNANWDKIDTAMAGGGLPDQTDKAGYLLTTDGSEASWGETGEIYPVVETYINETSWYRVYSDGWCEQGGLYTNTSTQTVSFLKTFSNTNYCVYFGKSANDTQPIVAQAINRTTSGFTLACAFNGSSTGYQREYFWQACGYIEV